MIVKSPFNHDSLQKLPLNHHDLLKSTTKNHHWNRFKSHQIHLWKVAKLTTEAANCTCVVRRPAASPHHPWQRQGAKSMGFPIGFPYKKGKSHGFFSLVFPKKHVGFSQFYPSSINFPKCSKSMVFQFPSPWHFFPMTILTFYRMKRSF